MKTDLNRLFDELNRHYWRGRLPKYTVRRLPWKRIGSDGCCDYKTQRIELASECPAEKLRAVLLHEMIHIQYPDDGHGPQFRRQLRRLIKHGEQELAKHLTQCLTIPDAGPERLTKEMFSQELIEMRGEIRYWTVDNPRRRWRTLLRHLRSLYEWPYWHRLWVRFGAKQAPHNIYTWIHNEWEQVRTGLKTGEGD